jgi:hypothetical protein
VSFSRIALANLFRPKHRQQKGANTGLANYTRMRPQRPCQVHLPVSGAIAPRGWSPDGVVAPRRGAKPLRFSLRAIRAQATWEVEKDCLPFWRSENRCINLMLSPPRQPCAFKAVPHHLLTCTILNQPAYQNPAPAYLSFARNGLLHSLQKKLQRHDCPMGIRSLRGSSLRAAFGGEFGYISSPQPG